MDQDPVKKIQSTNLIDMRTAIDTATGGDDNAEVDINKFEDALIQQTTLAQRVGLARAKAFFAGMVGQESAGGKDLTSPDGARGAYQVMPGTAKQFKMDVNDPYHNRFMGISYWDEGFRKAIEANNPNIGTDTVSLAGAATAYYHGGPGALNKLAKTGRYSTIADGGGMTTDDHVLKVLQNWSDNLKAQGFGGALTIDDEVAKEQAEKGIYKIGIDGNPIMVVDSPDDKKDPQAQATAGWKMAVPTKPEDSTQIDTLTSNHPFTWEDVNPDNHTTDEKKANTLWVMTDGEYAWKKIPTPEEMRGLQRRTYPLALRPFYDQANDIYKKVTGEQLFEANTPEDVQQSSAITKDSTGNNRRAVAIKNAPWLNPLMDTIRTQGYDAALKGFQAFADDNARKLKEWKDNEVSRVLKESEERINTGTTAAESTSKRMNEADAKSTVGESMGVGNVPGAFMPGFTIGGMFANARAFFNIANPDSKIASTAQLAEQEWNNFTDSFLSGGMGIAGAVVGRTMGGDSILNQREWADHLDNTLTSYGQYIASRDQAAIAVRQDLFKKSGAADYKWNIPVTELLAKGPFTFAGANLLQSIPAIRNKIPTIEIHPFELGKDVAVGAAEMTPVMAASIFAGPVGGMYYYGLYSSLLRGQSIADAGGEAFLGALQGATLHEVGSWMKNIPALYRPTLTGTLMGGTSTFMDYRRQMDEWNALPDELKSQSPKPSLTFNNFVKNAALNTLLSVTEVLPKESSVLHSLEIFNRKDLPSVFKGVMAAESLGILPTASPEVTSFQRGGLESLKSMATTPLEFVPSEPSAIRATIESVNKALDGFLNVLGHKIAGTTQVEGDEFSTRVGDIQKKGAEILAQHLQSAKDLLGDIYEKVKGDEPLTEEDKKGFLFLVNGVNARVERGFEAINEMQGPVQDAISLMQNSDQARGSLEITKNIGGTTIHEAESLNDPRGSLPAKRIDNGVVNVGTFRKPGVDINDPDSVGHFVTVIEADGTKHTFEVDSELAEVYRNRQRAIGRAVAEGASEEAVTNLVAENQLSPNELENLAMEHERRLQEEYEAKQAEIVRLLIKPSEERTPEEAAQVNAYIKKEAAIEALREAHGGDEPRWVTEARWRSLRSQNNMLAGYLPALDMAVTIGWDLLKAGKEGMEWYEALKGRLGKIVSFPDNRSELAQYNEELPTAFRVKLPKQTPENIEKAIVPYANSIYDNAMFLKESKVRDNYIVDPQTGEIRPAFGSKHQPQFHAGTKSYKDFDMAQVGATTDPGWYAAGAYFGPIDVANLYHKDKSGRNFTKSWVSIKNPIYYTPDHVTLHKYLNGVKFFFGYGHDDQPQSRFGHNPNYDYSLPKGMDEAAATAVKKYFDEYYNTEGLSSEDLQARLTKYTEHLQENIKQEQTIAKPSRMIEDEGNDIIHKLLVEHGTSYEKPFKALNEEAQYDLANYVFTYHLSYSKSVLHWRVPGEDKLNVDLENLERLRIKYNRLARERRRYLNEVSKWTSRTDYLQKHIGQVEAPPEQRNYPEYNSHTLSSAEVAELTRNATNEAMAMGYDGALVLKGEGTKSIYGDVLEDPYGEAAGQKPTEYKIEEVVPFSTHQIRSYFQSWRTSDSFNGELFNPTKPPVVTGRETGQDGFSINPIIMIADLYNAQKKFTRAAGSAFNRAFKYVGLDNPNLMAALTRFTSESQTARLAMKQFQEMSPEQLEKAGISHNDYLTSLIYDRLDGIKARWHRWGLEAQTLSDDDFINRFNVAGGGTEIDWRTAISAIHHNLGKGNSWVLPVGDIMAELRNAAYTNDFSLVRTLTSNMFDKAGGEVKWESPSFPRADYEALKADPDRADALKKLDFYYKSTIESPLRYSFNLTDNSPSNALGPRQTYIPLIHDLDIESDEGYAAASGNPKPGPLALNQLKVWYTAKREFLARVNHPAAKFATGFSEYMTDTAQLVNSMIRQIRAGNVAGTVDTLKQMGLVQPAIIDPATGRASAPSEDYKLMPEGTSRTFMVKEDIAGIGLTSYFTPKSKMMYIHNSVYDDVQKLVDTNAHDNMSRMELLGLATGIYLKGISDFVIHSQNQIDATRRNMGFLPVNYFNTEKGSTPVKLGKALLNLGLSGLGKIDIQGLPVIAGTALGLPGIATGALSALAPRVIYSFFKIAEHSTSKEFEIGDKQFGEQWNRAWDVVQSGSAPTEYGVQTFDPKTANETGAQLVGLYRSPMMRNMLRRLGMNIPEPKNAQDLEDTSKLGMLFGKVINLSPSIFGFDGVDMRGRMAVAESIHHYAPNATPWEKFQIFAGMGVYNRYFESQIGGMLKSVGFSPFYSAASAGLRRGIQSWTHATGSEGLTIMRNASDMSPAEKTAFTVRSALSNSAFSYTAAWAFNWHASTGKWPWEDPRARYGQVIQDQEIVKENETWFPSWVPAKDIAEQARTAVKEWSHTGAVGKTLDYATKAVSPDPTKDLYITLDPINGVLRGARALGIKGAFDAAMKLSVANTDTKNPLMATLSGRNYNGRPITPEGETPEQRSLAQLFSDIVVDNKALTAIGKSAAASTANTLMHLGLSNPVPHMGSAALIGSKLQFYNEFDPVRGGSSVKPFSIDSRTQQGLGATAWRRFMATAGALNSLSDNVESIATGNSPNSYVDIDQSRMAQALKVITDLALRTVFQQINAEQQSKTAATAMMKAKIDYQRHITGSIPTEPEKEEK